MRFPENTDRHSLWSVLARYNIVSGGGDGDDGGELCRMKDYIVSRHTDRYICIIQTQSKEDFRGGLLSLSISVAEWFCIEL